VTLTIRTGLGFPPSRERRFEVAGTTFRGRGNDVLRERVRRYGSGRPTPGLAPAPPASTAPARCTRSAGIHRLPYRAGQWADGERVDVIAKSPACRAFRLLTSKPSFPRRREPKFAGAATTCDPDDTHRTWVPAFAGTTFRGRGNDVLREQVRRCDSGRPTPGLAPTPPASAAPARCTRSAGIRRLPYRPARRCRPHPDSTPRHR